MKYFVGLLMACAAMPAYAETGAVTKQPLAGWLDSADCSAISGWAWDEAQPSARVEINLYDGGIHGSPFATLTASNNRLDLQQAGIGDGAHGFYLSTPASLKDGRTHSIVAAIVGSDKPVRIGANTLSCPAGASGYQYYFSDRLTTLSPDSWAIRGDASSAPDGVTSAGGAVLLSRLAMPDQTSEMEVRASLNLKQSGGVYSIYLHASPDALAGPTPAGSYYAVEVENPTFSEKGCTATLSISKRSSESVTSLHSESIACHDGMTLRAIAGADGHLGVWLDYWNLTKLDDAEVSGGVAGIGVRGAPAENSIGGVDLGQLDRLAPGPLAPADVQFSASSSSVKLEWPRLTDDPDGTGVGIYTVSRDGKFIANVSRANPDYVDSKVEPGMVYTYEIAAYDMHLNRTNTFVTVATPESGTAATK
jgi:hypothetical protein